MKDIAIFGAGGFGMEVACIIRQINESKSEPVWNLLGFIDDNTQLWGKETGYGKVLGGTGFLEDYPNELCVCIAIGDPQTIVHIKQSITNHNIEYPNIIAPSVSFLDEASLTVGEGNIICSNCLISCNVSIGDFNILNGFIPVGHDTTIGNYNVIMPSVNISGGVEIGNGNFFGVQSVVLQYKKIGNNVRVGANSVIMRNTKDNNLYMGNPATKVKF